MLGQMCVQPNVKSVDAKLLCARGFQGGPRSAKCQPVSPLGISRPTGMSEQIDTFLRVSPKSHDSRLPLARFTSFATASQIRAYVLSQ